MFTYIGERAAGRRKESAPLSDRSVHEHVYEEISHRKHPIAAPRYRWHVLPIAKLPGHSEIIGHIMFTRCNIAIKIAAGQHEHEYFTLCRNVRKFQLKRRGKKRTRESPLCQQL